MSDLHRLPRWRALRREVLTRDGYRCRACGRPGRLEADHIVAVRDGGDAWSLDNLQALCRGCHIAKTRRENAERSPTSPARRAWAEVLARIEGPRAV